MISLIICINSGIYFMLSLLHERYHRKEIMETDSVDGVKIGELEPDNETIKIYLCENKREDPIYVGYQYVKVPVGGETTIVENLIFTRSFNDTNNIEMYKNIDLLPNEQYINTERSLIDILDKYKINESQFRIALPMKMYTYKSKTPLFHSKVNSMFMTEHAFSSYDKHRLILKCAKQKRFPLTKTMLGMCLVTGIYWQLYKDEYYANKNWRY